MKEEGFVNGALNQIKKNGTNARFLTNQALFDSPDKSKIQAPAKVSIAFALNVYNENHNDLNDLITKATNARTVGGIKKIIKKAEKIIDSRD